MELRREVRVLKMERDLLSRRGLLRTRERPAQEVISAFIEAEKADVPIAFACVRLGVSRSGFHGRRRRRRSPSMNRLDDQVLTETIHEVHRQSRGT